MSIVPSAATMWIHCVLFKSHDCACMNAARRHTCISAAPLGICQLFTLRSICQSWCHSHACICCGCKLPCLWIVIPAPLRNCRANFARQEASPPSQPGAIRRRHRLLSSDGPGLLVCHLFIVHQAFSILYVSRPGATCMNAKRCEHDSTFSLYIKHLKHTCLTDRLY